VLNAASTAATRVGGPVLDVMIGALDPRVFAGISAIIGVKKISQNLLKKGIVLWPDEEYLLERYLAGQDWEAIRNVVREAALRHEAEMKGQR
jgi:hypothetical protein